MPTRVGGGGSEAWGQGVDLALVSIYGAAHVEDRERGVRRHGGGGEEPRAGHPHHSTN